MELSRGAVASGMRFAESHSCWHEYLAQALDWTISSLMEKQPYDGCSQFL